MDTADKVGVFEAKAYLSTLLKRVEAGERIVICRHGKPIAELGPVRSKVPCPKRGIAKDKSFWMAEDFDAPLSDFDDYME